jgi:hypothetical protein
MPVRRPSDSHADTVLLELRNVSLELRNVSFGSRRPLLRYAACDAPAAPPR